MSEQENEQINQQTEEVAVEAEVDYKALYEQTKTDLDALVNKKEELLGETKKAKEARKEALQKIDELKQHQSEDMKKNGEFEKLWQTEQQRSQELESKLNDFKTNVKTEKLKATALKVANKLSKGHAESAELLSTFVEQSLTQYADELGSVDANVLESVERQFQSDKRYAPLLGGSKATGGGAVGGKPGTTQGSEITRDQFDAMSNSERDKYLAQNKGKIYWKQD